MKTRNPKEFASAVTQIRAAVGEDACAMAVGRSQSLIRKWADPDHPAIPNLYQALSLDSAFVRAGHGGGPILKLYEDLLEQAQNEPDADADDIVPGALMLQALVGDLSELIHQGMASNGGSLVNLTPHHRAILLDLIDRLEEETDRLEDAVEYTDGQ